MKCFQTIFYIIIFIIFFVFGVQHSLAKEKQPIKKNRTLDLVGTLISSDGKPVPNAKITIKYNTKKIRTAVSDKVGQFFFKTAIPGLADIIFDAPGYYPIVEREVLLLDNTDLSRTMQKKSIGSWWVTLLLLIPGVASLIVVTFKICSQKKTKYTDQGNNIQQSKIDQKTKMRDISVQQLVDNPFKLAAIFGTIWILVFVLLAYIGDLGQDIYKVHLFHPSMAFDYYVPILGFIGALLYVLDLFRKHRDRFPRGTEFGIRLVMGPYVAIVMVTLFGNNLGFVDLTSPIANGTIAFISGLLVIVALQSLTEKGNELLGRWRQKSRYERSEIAEKFNLSLEEDQKLQKAGINHLIQLRDRDIQDLIKDVIKVNFDENLAVELKKQLQKEKLRKNIGDLFWERLKNINAKTTEDFAHLTDEVLQEISDQVPKLNVEDLKVLRNQAKKLVIP